MMLIAKGTAAIEDISVTLEKVIYPSNLKPGIDRRLMEWAVGNLINRNVREQKVAK